MLTGDNWGQLMLDLTKNTPDCVDDPPFNASYCGFNDHPGCLPLNGCGSIIAYPVLIMFMIITTLILLSVFISVIISNYIAIKESPVTPAEFDDFAKLWAEFDPGATCYIKYELLFPFVFSLSSPLGFESKTCSRRQYGKRVGSVKVSKDKLVYFEDVLTALSKAHVERKARCAIGNDFDEKVKPIMSARKKFLHRSILFFNHKGSANGSAEVEEVFTVTHYLAVDLISEVWAVKKSQRGASDARDTVQVTNGVSQKSTQVLGVIISTPQQEHEVDGSGRVMRIGRGSQVVLTKSGSSKPPQSPTLIDSSHLKKPHSTNNSKFSVSRLSPQSFSSPFSLTTDSNRQINLSVSDVIIEEKADDSDDSDWDDEVPGGQPFQLSHQPIHPQTDHLHGGSTLYNRLPPFHHPVSHVNDFGPKLPNTTMGSYVKRTPRLYQQNIGSNYPHNSLMEESVVHRHSSIERNTLLDTNEPFIDGIEGFYKQETLPRPPNFSSQLTTQYNYQQQPLADNNSKHKSIRSSSGRINSSIV